MLKFDFDDLNMLLETAETLLAEYGKGLTDGDDFSDSDKSDFGIEDILSDFTMYVNSLMDLVPALEDPAVDNVEHSNAPPRLETFHVPLLAQSYCRKIRDRFQKISVRQVETFGTANAQRAERLQRLKTKAPNVDSRGFG